MICGQVAEQFCELLNFFALHWCCSLCSRKSCVNSQTGVKKLASILLLIIEFWMLYFSAYFQGLGTMRITGIPRDEKKGEKWNYPILLEVFLLLISLAAEFKKLIKMVDWDKDFVLFIFGVKLAWSMCE